MVEEVVIVMWHASLLRIQTLQPAATSGESFPDKVQ